MLCLSEQGLYFFLGRSDKPRALPYQMYISGDVMPSIRKHGAYITATTMDEMIADPDFAIRLLTELKTEREKNKALIANNKVNEQRIAELEPKASYYDYVLSSMNAVPITVIAKDYGWSGKKLNAWLHEKGIQYKLDDTWLLYAKYTDKGYTKSNTVVIENTDGEPISKMHTKWTQSGRLFIYEMLKNEGILPLIEHEKGVYL